MDKLYTCMSEQGLNTLILCVTTQFIVTITLLTHRILKMKK